MSHASLFWCRSQFFSDEREQVLCNLNELFSLFCVYISVIKGDFTFFYFFFKRAEGFWGGGNPHAHKIFNVTLYTFPTPSPFFCQLGGQVNEAQTNARLIDAPNNTRGQTQVRDKFLYFFLCSHKCKVFSRICCFILRFSPSNWLY